MSGLDRWPALPVLHAWSAEAIGDFLRSHGARMDSCADAIYPIASRAIFIPFVLRRPYSPLTAWWYNGTAVLGNVDVGLYDQRLQRLTSSGSVAQAGVSQYQSAALVAPPRLAPGLYYLASVMDNITGRLFRIAPSGTMLGLCCGVKMTAGVFPLPADASAATPNTVAQVSLAGVTSRSFM